MVISSYQKSANPSRSQRKNLSRNEKSNDTTNENRLCRRQADTRNLKSLSATECGFKPRRWHEKAQNCSLIRMILGFLGFLSNVWLKQVKTANRNQWYDIVVEGGADTVLDVCIAGAEFCKPIRIQRYSCGS